MPADPTPQRQPPGQTLLFDADDTLWVHNVYFERAIAAFIGYLDHRTHSPEEVREHLNRVEHATIATHGYGLKSFRRALVMCFEQLSASPVTAEKRARIASFSESIAGHSIETLPGVAATLAELSTRHRCLLVTKGDPVEQHGKLTRSGLAAHFSVVEVLPEKNTTAYRDLVFRHGCAPARTWMIGTSPRSDINPALAAGLHAVFLPHNSTWVLEHETINQPPPDRRLLVLSAFASLAHHF